MRKPFGGLDVEVNERNHMRASGRTESQVDKGMISIASVLLVGIVVLAAGHFSGNRIAFYAGVLVTLTGVFTGIQRIIVQGESWRTKR
jgi:uncharacterized membrane protein HdeD (DUF308 family)